MSAVNEPWRFCQTGLQYVILVYLIMFVANEDEDSWPKMLALCVFFSYMRLISFARFLDGPRKLVATIMYVTKKSIPFYIILMIYVVCVSFSTMALREEDEFRPYFEIAYRAAFADWEESFEAPSELIGFLIRSFIGPLLLLNLLIVIMGDAQAECQESWEVQEIREKYLWA